ncbi:hypothetical protein FRB90_011922 [Tulasnella sp. 427]|nr:hypothetical protein FRB90_011922 [Tulasnella sp. 427]
MPNVVSFNTQEVHLWNNPQKETSKVLNLPQSCVAPPRVVCGLNSLDMQTGTNLRCRATTTDIKNQQFTAHIDTWADTTLYSSSVDCLVLKPGNLDILTGQFSTEEDHPWNKPQTQTSRRINFERPFVTAPKVIVFFKQFDTGSGTSTRLKTYTSDIDPKGFTLHIETWADTILYSATAGWFAYPEDRDHTFSGTANTMDVRPWQNPIAQNQKTISFQNTGFWRKPFVFCALNWIDISTDANLRVRAYCDNISGVDMTWHIDSWADTKLWSAGISYLVFN